MPLSRSVPRTLVQKTTGVSILETAVAVAMSGLFISTLLAMSSNALGLLRTAKDNVSASQALQERVEKMRIANWLQITDGNYLANTLLASNSDSASGLSNPIETITVTAYRAGGAEPTVCAGAIRRNGATQIAVLNPALKDERMVRVDVSLTWRGFPRNRPRARATTALIAKGGITK
jgi:hypothetical protein